LGTKKVPAAFDLADSDLREERWSMSADATQSSDDAQREIFDAFPEAIS
jgi:hypothetical protein